MPLTLTKPDADPSETWTVHAGTAASGVRPFKTYASEADAEDHAEQLRSIGYTAFVIRKGRG